jgi:protein-S-isoprenylcysteine O-methyltransferase Ste14
MSRALDLKVPPAAVVVLTAALMWLGARALPSAGFHLPGRPWAAGGIVLAGALLVLLGVVCFRRANTTVNPMSPASSSALVTSGVYRVTRNPMYLGFLLILSGWAVWLSNAMAFAPLPGFALYLDCFQIRPEERALASRFGQEFDAYKARVRRWI